MSGTEKGFSEEIRKGGPAGLPAEAGPRKVRASCAQARGTRLSGCAPDLNEFCEDLRTHELPYDPETLFDPLLQSQSPSDAEMDSAKFNLSAPETSGSLNDLIYIT